MLEVRHLSKRFRDIPALSDISLTVERGDVTAVIGPSGSGKTTLLRCMNFLETADSGELTFKGKTVDLHRVSRKDMAAIRRNTGFVFQSFNLFANKTALQNVTEGLTIVRHLNAETAKEIALHTLDRVGMRDRADHYPSQLSGGQQQRVAIARAMAANRDIIYFDEPTSSLDPELIGEVLSVMRDLASSGMTMLVVTHEMRFARDVSNHVIFMDAGRILEENDSSTFFASPRETRAQAFLNSLHNS